MQRRTWYWIIAAVVIILAIWLFWGAAEEPVPEATAPAAVTEPAPADTAAEPVEPADTMTEPADN